MRIRRILEPFIAGVARWWTATASRRSSALIGAVVGMVTMIHAFGVRYVLGTSPYWEYPTGDAKTYLGGYYHFIAEPWGWPLGIVRAIEPPEGFSIAMMDTIPLIALPAKLVAPLVPRALDSVFLHPIGLWILLVYVFQGVVAARFDRLVGGRSNLTSLLAALFACTLPAFISRFPHAALDAHGFLIWALLLVVLARRDPPTTRHGLEAVAILALATLTHPYLLAMSIAIFSAWAGTALLHHRSKVVWWALPAGLAVVPSLMAALGILQRTTVTGQPWGWGENSFNPLSLVLTKYSAIQLWLAESPVCAKLLDPSRADATGFQVEGYDYLGAGIWLALLVTLTLHRRGLAIALRRHAVLAIVLLGLVVFALSSRVFVGRTLLFTYPVPEFLRPLTSQFRASGRFIWAPTYALLLFALLRLARSRQGLAILAGCAIVQIVDLNPLVAWTREFVRTPQAKRLDWSTWKPLIDRHDVVIAYPTFECLWYLRGEADLTAYHELYELSYLAAEQHKIVNTFHNPRPHRDCAAELTEKEQLRVESRTLYVVARREVTGQLLANMESQGARCVRFDEGYACSREMTDDLAHRLSRSATRSSEAIFKGSNASSFQGAGFDYFDDTGAWIGHPGEGRRTSILFAIGAPPGSWLELDIDHAPGIAAKMLVEVGGMKVGEIEAGGGRPSETKRYAVPPASDDDVVVDIVQEKAGKGPLRLRAARIVSNP